MNEKVHEVLSHFTPAVVGLIIFLVTQGGFALIWLTRMESRLALLEGLQQTIERMDNQGTRANALLQQTQTRGQVLMEGIVKRMDAFDAKEHEFNLTVARESGIIRNNVENLRSDISRLQEQQQRIIQALDSQNNALQELRQRIK